METPPPRRLSMTLTSGQQGENPASEIVTTIEDPVTGDRASGYPGPLLVVTRGEPL